jgi:hypothetical protein
MKQIQKSDHGHICQKVRDPVIEMADAYPMEKAQWKNSPYVDLVIVINAWVGVKTINRYIHRYI